MNTHPSDRLAAIKAQIAELEREAAALRELLQSGQVTPCGAEWVAQFQVRVQRRIAIADAERLLPGNALGALVSVRKQVVLHLVRIGDLAGNRPSAEAVVEPDTGEREAA